MTQNTTQNLTQLPPNRPGASLAGPSPRLLLVAVLLAVASVVLTNLYVAQVRAQVDQQSFEVFLLTASVQPGEVLRQNNVRSVRVPMSFATSFEQLGYVDRSALEARMYDREPVQRAATQNAIVTFSLFTPPGGADIDRQITPGRRWISLPINSRTAPGSLRIGMFVDLEGVFIGEDGRTTILPVMERVKVIALGDETMFDPDDMAARRRSFQTMTIEVSPAEATQLNMAQRVVVGEFHLHMRNPGDEQLVKIPEGGVNPRVMSLVSRALNTPADDRRSR